MTGSEQLFGDPQSIGRRLKTAIREATGGLTASVGLSATKYVAKVASACQKPDGLTVVPPEEAKAWLAPLLCHGYGAPAQRPSTPSPARSAYDWGRGSCRSAIPFREARKGWRSLPHPGPCRRSTPGHWAASIKEHWIRTDARRGCAREGGYQISPASISRYDRQASQKKELRSLRCRDKA